jgi:uncharacterized protein (DUF305 family)
MPAVPRHPPPSSYIPTTEESTAMTISTTLRRAALACALAAASGLALAQGGHAHGPAGGDTSPSTREFQRVNDRMHRDMAIKFTGDADVDFVRGMIPHHQGAVDMARVVLKHGKDPEVRKLAEEIIRSQEAEIAWMRDWLKKRGR